MARRSVSLIAGSAVLLSALTASAQSLIPESRPERPYRGVYADGTDQSAHVLSVNGSAGTGYDTSATTAAAEAGVPGLGFGTPSSPRGSMYNQFSGGLSYSARFAKFGAGASVSSTLRQ